MTLTTQGWVPGSKNQGMEAGRAPLTVICNGPPEDFVFDVSSTLSSAGLEILISKETNR